MARPTIISVIAPNPSYEEKPQGQTVIGPNGQPMQVDQNGRPLSKPAQVSPSSVVWQVGSPMPNEADTRIDKIVIVGDFVEIFASPIGNSQLIAHGLKLHFMMPVSQVKLIASVASNQDWLKLMQESEEAYQYEGGDDEEEEEEEVDQQQSEPQEVLQQGMQPMIPNFSPPVQQAVTTPGGES